MPTAPAYQNPALSPSTAYSGTPAPADPYANLGPQFSTTSLSQPNAPYQTTDPNAPSYVDPASYSMFNPTGATQTPTNPSWYQSANQFITSPVGQVAGAATVGGIAMYQANQANQNAAKLAGSISTIGAPYTASGAQQLQQIQPGLQTGTAQSTAAATELGNVAIQYGTGNLTPAQNTQVQSFVQQQRAQLDSQLAASGNLDSSYRQAQYQQIDNNAAMLTQQLVNQNIQMAQGALNTVQQTYSSMLNQALAQSGFGLGAQTQAVSLLLQNDQQTSAQLNKLFAALANGLGNSAGGKTNQPGQPGSSGGNAVQQMLAKLTGGGGNVNQPGPNAQWNPAAGQPSQQDYATQLGTNFPGAPMASTDYAAAGMQDPNNPASAANIQASLSNIQPPNFNIDTSGGGDGGAVSFGTGDGGGG